MNNTLAIKAVDKVLRDRREPGAAALKYGPHEDFCQMVASGCSQLKAYQSCVATESDLNTRHMSQAGSRLASQHSERIACLRLRAESLGIVTVAEVAEKSRRVYDTAMDLPKPDLRAANGATRNLGDMAGAFKRKDSGGDAPMLAINMIFSSESPLLTEVEAIVVEE